MKYSFVFGFRNREIIRVRRCMDSLAAQDFKDFEVVFVDFGSDVTVAEEVKNLCAEYPFVRYYYNEVRGMPWNRSHALNTGVRLANGEYIIFGDVDLIYSSNFLDTVNAVVKPGITLYGECLFLPEEFSDWNAISSIDPAKLKSFGKSGKGGVHVVEKSTLVEIGAYDEFYCYWGVEDRDLNYRLLSIGLREEWISSQAPVFHQWHPVTSDFYKSGFPLQWWEEMNIYFEYNKDKLVRNNGKWGLLLTSADRPVLCSHFRKEDVQLDCIDSIFELKGKTQTIATIFTHLRTLQDESCIRFLYKRSGKDFLSRVDSSQYFSRVILKPKEWDRVKRHIHKLSNRMNHFIPEEDLHFIFCEIAKKDTRYDYAFYKTDQLLTWEFALKTSVK